MRQLRLLLDSRFANYDIFVNNDVAEYAPATYYTAAEADAYNATIGGHVSAGDVQTPAVYTQIPVSTALVDGTTYYTAADGSTSIVYEDGTSAANNGTNYWEKTSNAVLYMLLFSIGVAQSLRLLVHWLS